MWIHRAVAAWVGLLSLAGCVGVDEGDPDRALSVRTDGLTVGGHYCPTTGEIAGRTQPADHRYFITTFGGGADTQPMACGGTADGRWLYIADSWRFGCRAHVRVSHPTNHRYCVTQVGDVGPNICVEQAAGLAIIDASPMVTQHLYGVGGAGWSDRMPVIAVAVASSTPLGCGVETPVVDAGVMDAGARDAGVLDAGVRDAGAADVGSADVGVRDGTLGTDVPAVRDGAASDAAGLRDATAADVGSADAATRDATDEASEVTAAEPIAGGCGCRANVAPSKRAIGLSAWGFAMLAARRRRRWAGRAARRGV